MTPDSREQVRARTVHGPETFCKWPETEGEPQTNTDYLFTNSYLQKLKSLR